MSSAVDRIVLSIAALQIVLGLNGVLLAGVSGAELSRNLPLWVFPVQMLAFASTAGVLLRGAKGDDRVVSLAGQFLLIGASFARAPTLHLEAVLEDPWWIAVVRGMRVDAFLPYYVWRFFTQFPRALVSHRVRAFADIAIAATALVGLVLAFANLVGALSSETPGWLAPLDVNDERAAYWAIVYGLMLPAIPFALWKAGRASAQERRRASLFATGVAFAASPMVVYAIAMGASEAFADWFAAGGARAILPVIELLIFSIPLTTAYAVLVDRALPVRVTVRQVARYALARGVVAVGALLPFAWIAWTAYQERDRTLQELASGRQALGFAAAGFIGVMAVTARTRARAAIDRAFFREAFDAREILRSVAESCQRVRRVGDLAELLAKELDRAFHPQRLVVLIAQQGEGMLRAARGTARPLAQDTELCRVLAETREPLDVDLEHPGRRLTGIPEEQRYWLAEGGFRLLVPLVSEAGELIGVLGLGEKRSELGYTVEDHQLLSTLAAAGALTLEARLRAGSLPLERAVDPSDQVAGCCTKCGFVARGQGAPCEECGSETASIGVPQLLLAKFRLDRRIGEGSMGVVFRASDLELERDVAVKTLPRTTPEEIAALRREARAMASVVHPHLAVLYSAESWKGTPLLVTEFLSAGTLADEKESLDASAARELGVSIASALGTLHRSGVLHRDVKPSNIAFNEEGVAKLLDFGLASVVGESAGGGLVGTPLYLSPEALAGGRLDPDFDLWALAVVLYEALAGAHPFERRTWAETRGVIDGEDPLAAAPPLPERAAPLLPFFTEALSSERGRRPRSARELSARWSEACERL